LKKFIHVLTAGRGFTVQVAAPSALSVSRFVIGAM
jgi:hypothetical protein